MDYITVKEAAQLQGCTDRTIRTRCKSGEIECVVSKSAKGKDMYLIPVSALRDDAQKRFYKQLRDDAGALPTPAEAEKKRLKQRKSRDIKPLENYTAEEREQIGEWRKIIDEWNAARAMFEKKTEADPLFIGKCKLEHPGIEVSVDILYRKAAAMFAEDYDTVLSVRGGWNKGSSTVDGFMFDVFQCFYMYDNKLPITLCYDLTADWFRDQYPDRYADFPKINAFYYRVKRDISDYAKECARNGEKALRDRYAPYVMRCYEMLDANTVWFADNHTLDIEVTNEEGKKMRLYVTAFLDAKTGVMVGWNITDTPSSQSTLLALRHAILHYGIPEFVYVDNGREFLTKDVGGLGHRKKRSQPENPFPPNVLERLGITMLNANVRNARAKSIERAFLTVKNHYSRLWTGYTGGNVMEKKESLKHIVKRGMLPLDEQIYDSFEAYINGDYNQSPYGGTEKRYKGMTRIEAWGASIAEQRKCTESELTLLLARSTGYQKVKRNGVCITIHGEKLWYMDPEETYKYIGKEVYVRYDPRELRSVRIYDKSDAYMQTWSFADHLILDLVGEDPEKVTEANRSIRYVQKKMRKEAFAHLDRIPAEQRIDILATAITRNRYRLEGFEIPQAKIIVPYHADEPQSELKKAAGENIEYVPIDLDKIAKKYNK